MTGFSEKQQAYFENALCRWNVKQGATRSGKTYMDYFLIPKRIRRVAKKPGLVVLLGNTRGTLQRNLLLPMREIWGSALVGELHADGSAQLFGEECCCMGADKAIQADRLRGASVKYCYGDEVASWNQEVFEMLKSRLDKPYSCFDGTCNPQDPRHWFKRFLESGGDLYQQQYTLDDNPFLDAAFVENLKREYAGTVYYDRYVLGRWALAEGLIYPMFSPERHVVPTVERAYERYHISCDYGTQNPTSMGLWGRYQNRWYRVRESYHDGRNGGQRTDEEHYQELERLAGTLPIQSVVVDPSAASFLEVIRRHGRFSCRRAVNDVKNGIRRVAVKLQNGELLFNDCCKAILDEFYGYAWDKTAEEERPIKEKDHAMDDLRYFVNTILGDSSFSFT